MDKALEMSMVFDFFGDLLTEKQREYFDLYYNEDLSLSEIAEKAGISRQGVHDIISRAERTLMDLEQKTGVVAKWLNSRSEIERAGEVARRLSELLINEGETAGLAHELVLILEAMI